MADDNDPDKNEQDEDIEKMEESEDVGDDGFDEDDGSDMDSLVEEATQEYVALDTTLNQLDSYLNVLEQKNDDLYAKVQELLESSRQTRLEMQQANQQVQGAPHREEEGDPSTHS